jgi:hypothetical protein
VWGSGCIDPSFLDLDTNWNKVVSFTPRPLYPWGKGPKAGVYDMENTTFLTLTGLKLRSLGPPDGTYITVPKIEALQENSKTRTGNFLAND